MYLNFIKNEFKWRFDILITLAILFASVISIAAVTLEIYYAAIIPIAIALLVGASVIFSGNNERLNKVLIYSFILYITSSLLWPRYVALWIPGLPSINLQRIATAFSLTMIAVSLLYGKWFRNEIFKSIKNNAIIWISIFTFVIFRFLSIFSSQDTGTSTYQYINEIFVHVIFIVAGVAIGSDVTRARWFALTITICFYIATIIGAIEYILGKNLFANFVDPTNAYVQWALSEKVRGGGYRSQSTFGHPLTYAEFASVGFCFAVYISSKTKKSFWKYLGITTAFLCATSAVITSGSRAGYGVFAVTASLIALAPLLNAIFRKKLNLKMVTIWAFLSILLAIIFTAAALIIYEHGFGEKSYAISNNARALMYERGLYLATKSPIFGYGLGMAADTIGIRSGNGVSQYTIDSLLLSLLVDSGVFVIISFFSVCIISTARSFSSAFKGNEENWFFWYALGSSILSMLLFKSILSLPDNNFLLFSLIGLSVCGIQRNNSIKN